MDPFLKGFRPYSGEVRVDFRNSPNLVAPNGPVSEEYGKDKPHFRAFQIHSFPTNICLSRLKKFEGVYALREVGEISENPEISRNLDIPCSSNLTQT